MLEGISIITYVVVEVVRVSKKLILLDKEEYAAYVCAWQERIGRVFEHKHILILVGKALALFVSQVGGCVLIADNFRWFAYFNSTMVSGDV